MDCSLAPNDASAPLPSRNVKDMRLLGVISARFSLARIPSRTSWETVFPSTSASLLRVANSLLSTRKDKTTVPRLWPLTGVSYILSKYIVLSRCAIHSSLLFSFRSLFFALCSSLFVLRSLLFDLHSARRIEFSVFGISGKCSNGSPSGPLSGRFNWNNDDSTRICGPHHD